MMRISDTTTRKAEYIYVLDKAIEVIISSDKQKYPILNKRYLAVSLDLTCVVIHSDFAQEDFSCRIIHIILEYIWFGYRRDGDNPEWI